MAEQQLPHTLSLTERSKLTMTGATEVVSFDESAVVLGTTLGTLVIQGRDLQLKTLSLEGGKVEVAGTIQTLSYQEPREKRGWKGWLLG